jgi:hypothetical protein
LPHVCDPGVLLHITSASQPPLLVAHSSMSVQVTPSPLNPLLQVQACEPGVFEQSALALQPPRLVAHSSTSAQVIPSPE